MAFVVAAMRLYVIFDCLWLLSIAFFTLFLCVDLVLINRRSDARYQRVLALCAFLTGAIPKGLNLQTFCDICVCMFCLCEFLSWLILQIFENLCFDDLCAE